jgi:hypothetical protein
MAGVSVSYLFVGAYITFVVGGSLLVGLITPLVNLPVCQDNGVKKENFARVEPVENNLVHPETRNKRDALESSSSSRLLNVYQDERVKDILRNNKKYVRDEQASRNITDICPEIAAPELGVQYPWFNPRLPVYIRPINYEIELYLNDVSLNALLAFIVASFNVATPANYILLHKSKNDLPVLRSLVDKDGKAVRIACTGEFNQLRHDYYIIKTEQDLLPGDGPFELTFLVVDLIIPGERGIFKLDYGGSA